MPGVGTFGYKLQELEKRIQAIELQMRQNALTSVTKKEHDAPEREHSFTETGVLDEKVTDVR